MFYRPPGSRLNIKLQCLPPTRIVDNKALLAKAMAWAFTETAGRYVTVELEEKDNADRPEFMHTWHKIGHGGKHSRATVYFHRDDPLSNIVTNALLAAADWALAVGNIQPYEKQGFVMGKQVLWLGFNPNQFPLCWWNGNQEEWLVSHGVSWRAYRDTSLYRVTGQAVSMCWKNYLDQDGLWESRVILPSAHGISRSAMYRMSTDKADLMGAIQLASEIGFEGDDAGDFLQEYWR
jgi:hypothetical protein